MQVAPLSSSKPKSTTTLLLMAFVTLTVTGCGAIRTDSDVTVSGSSGLDRLVFGEYWTSTGFEDFKGLKTVAVASFEIELVKERTLYRRDNRGMARRRADYPDDLKNALPDRLYKLLEERLVARGKIVTPKRNVLSSSAYAQYPATAKGEARHSPPLEGSKGAISITEILPTSGLKAFGGDSAHLDRILARELGVDAVVHARFRIGIIEGRAAVEKGSVLVITTADASGKLESNRSLASEFSVLSNFGYTPTTQGAYHVAERPFFQRIDQLFVNYGSLVTEALPD